MVAGVREKMERFGLLTKQVEGSAARILAAFLKT